ncbi:MAG: antibiotic biosynthesis monooxygenase [Deltaproteobacteria bacterium]|nr:antibiotic biosynthesis monooxygenase [Deltaproteobacteria bacterium]
MLDAMMMTRIKVVLPNKARKDILEALCRFKNLAEISSGCIRSYITRDVNRRNAIIYWEEWQTREDMEKHISSPNYRQLLEIIELSAQKPDINFLTVTKIEALEVIETVRISR